MKHVIKGIALILALSALLLLPAGAVASDADMGGLTMEELNDWAGQVLAQAKASKPVITGLRPQKTEDGYELVYDFATLYLDTPALTDKSILNAISVTAYDVECPRGIQVYDTQQALLSAFANENPALLGSRDFAVLYLSDSLPEEALWGWVQRDDQQIQAVQYAVHERLPEGDQYTDCGLLYSLDGGYVTAVRAYGLSVSISGEQAANTVSEVLAVQREESYFAYPQSIVGTDLEPFERDDLFFSGLDFLSLTPETAIESFGAYETETWLEDDTGDWLRIMQWPKAEITFAYNPEKVFKRIDTLSLRQRGIEGPRGVQVGDALSSVVMRFRHGGGEYNGMSSEVLYGDGKTVPYGLAEYANASATLHYACAVEGGQDIKTVTLHMIFVDTMLSELFLYSW